MSITNTIATYLIFLAYINLTKFESFISIAAVGHALRAFSYKGSSTSESSEGGFAKIAPSFFFFFFSLVLFSFFLFFFFWGGRGWWLGGSFLLLFFSWGSGVPVLPGWIHGPFQGYYQIILVVNERWVVFGEKDKHYYSFNVTKVTPSCGFQTLMLTFTISWLTA